MSAESFYQLLGLPADADGQAIRRAHRALARALHPDVNKAPDAAARFAQVQTAYQTLIDPARRSAYDQGLRRGSTWQPTEQELQPHHAWADIARQEFEEEVDEIWRVFFEPRQQARANAGGHPRPAGRRE